MIRDQIILQKNYNSIGVKCFGCKQNDHATPDCSYLHFIPDRDRIIKIYVFNPQQKERRKFKRKPHQGHNALGLKIPIKMSCLKFREYLKQNHFHLMEEDKSDFFSLASLEDITEKDVIEYEKYRTFLNLEEEKRQSPLLNVPSLNLERPFISITKIKDDNNFEEVQETQIHTIDVEKPLLNSYREKENEPMHTQSHDSNKQIKLFRNPTSLSIDTSNSKSNEIIMRMKNRSYSSQYKEEDKMSFTPPKRVQEKKKPPETNSNFSIDSNSNSRKGSMIFNFDGIDLTSFNAKKGKQNTIDSFGSFAFKQRKRNKKQKMPTDCLKQKSIQNSIFQNPISLGKQKSMMEHDQKQQYENPLHEISKDYREMEEKNEQNKNNNKITNLLPVMGNIIFEKPKQQPNKSALLKKRNGSDEFDTRSPLLKHPVFGDTSKNDDKTIAEISSRKDNINSDLEKDDEFRENKGMLFETVRNFKNYFPKNNVKEVILKIVRYRRMIAQKKEKTRKKTRKFKEFVFEKNREIRKSFNGNKILPIVESVGGDILSSSRISTPKMHDRRASNIFIERSNTLNFFKKAIKYTFYDIVYEVLNNKDLRKSLYAMREKSQKVKLTSQLTNIV